MPEAVELIESAGLILDPWQRTVLELVMSERADGRWECREVAYLVARQNGKGAVLEALALIGLFLLDDVVEILFSAHEFKTAKKAYRQIRDRIKSTPHLLAKIERRGSRVVGFRQSNDDVSITLQDGTALRFMARSSNTARGFSPQMLIIDEAQECSEETRQALINTLRAQANGQAVWTGTVPHPTKNNSEAFTALRDRGRRGGDPTLGWAEWNPEGSDDTQWTVADDAAFYLAAQESNPAIGYRITPETIEADRSAAVTPEAIAGLWRECLSVWPTDDTGGAKWAVIDRGQWDSTGRTVVGRWMGEPMSVALEVAPDFSSSSLMVSGPCKDGEAVAVLAHGPGTNWIVDSCIEAQKVTGRPILIDEGSPADRFATAALQAADVDVQLMSTAEVSEAATAFLLGVREGRVLHRNDPDQQPLTAAVGAALLRPYTDASLWDRRVGAVICPLIAASLALWGSRQEVDGPSVYEDRGMVSL